MKEYAAKVHSLSPFGADAPVKFSPELNRVRSSRKRMESILPSHTLHPKCATYGFMVCNEIPKRPVMIALKDGRLHRDVWWQYQRMLLQFWRDKVSTHLSAVSSGGQTLRWSGCLRRLIFCLIMSHG